MTRKIGIIDLGSNTSRLIIMAYTPGESFQLIDQLRERVRLSAGMGAENILRPAPMERTLQLLKIFRKLCEAHGTATIVATATSATRDARNQAEFLDRAQKEAGLTLRVLSGKEEATYGYLGAINSLSFQNGLVIDIGGGSLELGRVQNRQLKETASLPLGAVRLTESFIRSDPPQRSDIRLLDRHIDTLLNNLKWLKTKSSGTLVGLGGTVRTLAKIDQKRRRYPLDRLHGYVVSLTSIENILHDLENMTLSQREKMPGLSSDRADVIVAGTLALMRLMRRAGYHEIQVCGQGLREGLFYEQFVKDSGATLVPDVRAFGLVNLAYLSNLNWPHARHVRLLALSLFDQLRALHRLGPIERSILAGAALLQDIGGAIDFHDRDQHADYLILNAELPGFSHREIALMSALTLYLQQGTFPLASFPGILTHADELSVRKLSGLLSLAEYLERGRTQVIQSISCRLRGKTIYLTAHTRGDASLEMWTTTQHADSFKQIFKRDLVIRLAPITDRLLANNPTSAAVRPDGTLPSGIKRAGRTVKPAGPSNAESLWSRVRELID